MFQDLLLTFSTAQALTATADATNVIDLLAAGQLGNGRPLSLFVNVDVAIGGTSPTFAVAITTDDNASLTSDTTIATKTIAAADLLINTLHSVDLPENIATERYLGVVYTLGGTSPTITVTSWLGLKGSIPNLYKGANGYEA